MSVCRRCIRIIWVRMWWAVGIIGERRNRVKRPLPSHPPSSRQHCVLYTLPCSRPRTHRHALPAMLPTRIIRASHVHKPMIHFLGQRKNIKHGTSGSSARRSSPLPGLPGLPVDEPAHARTARARPAPRRASRHCRELPVVPRQAPIKLGRGRLTQLDAKGPSRRTLRSFTRRRGIIGSSASLAIARSRRSW